MWSIFRLYYGIFVKILKFDLKALLDAKSLVLDNIFNVLHVSEETDNPIETDRLPV